MKTQTIRGSSAGPQASRRASLPALAAALGLVLLWGGAQASTVPGLSTPKVASDLRLAIEAAAPPRVSWLREVARERWVRVVVTGQKWAAPMTEAKKDVAARGGRVVSSEDALATLVVVLPATQIGAFAARADVLHVAPDRARAGTAVVDTTPVPTQAHLSAVGLGPQSARARSDLALTGE